MKRHNNDDHNSGDDPRRQVPRKLCDCKPPSVRLSLGPLPACLLRDPEDEKNDKEMVVIYRVSSINVLSN